MKCVSIAGLCHDIGHGPFSHTFEYFIKERIDKNWNHEIQSEVILRHLIDENNIDLDQYETNFIISLIQGKYDNKLSDKSSI